MYIRALSGDIDASGSFWGIMLFLMFFDVFGGPKIPSGLYEEPVLRVDSRKTRKTREKT